MWFTVVVILSHPTLLQLSTIIMFQLVSVLCELVYLSRLVIYLKARIKSLLTQMSRRRSLHSELKVLKANIMASNIADGFIH